MDQTLKEAKRLHALGFALHWLKPKSKLPLESGWTKGGRKTWAELEKYYRPGYNLGVRLGEQSRLKDMAKLAVIDCDVKSKDPKHLKEMRAKLAELVGSDSPRVASGRGNGSMHVYVKTKEAAQPLRYSQSKDTVKVHMPSVKPSKHELETFTVAELKSGTRLRAAWEISIMGEGQQVVLPPSIHPDSGKPYAWTIPFASIFDLPLKDFKAFKKEEKKYEESDFVAEFIDLDLLDLSHDMVALIRHGDACADRSAALLSATLALIREGVSDNAILTVLTDRENFLGQVAFDHAKTRDRRRAANWLRRYTLQKAKQSVAESVRFLDIEEPESLSESEAIKQSLELCGDPAQVDWEKKLVYSQNKNEGRVLKNTMHNVYYVLKGRAGPRAFIRNDFSNSDHYGVTPPWKGVQGEEVRDIDTVRIKEWFAREYKIEPSSDKINEAVLKIADENAFHPVRDYLNTLVWDGVPRIDTWIKDYHEGEGPEPYLSAVSRKTLVAMIARVMAPGCKYDQVLILEGKTGTGKSTAVSILSQPWFSDARLNIGDKDAVLTMSSVWVLELGELATMNTADVDQLKGFISQSTDRIRMPYGKRAENIPRQCIFIGTTNNEEYLKDPTGNRRYWPVHVGRCDFDRLKRDRDQLLAEAYQTYLLGEALYLDDPKANEQALQEQQARTFQDSWVDLIGNFLKVPVEGFDSEKFTTTDLFTAPGPLAGWKENRSEQYRAGDSLRLLGYVKIRLRNEQGFRSYFWVGKNSRFLSKNLRPPPREKETDTSGRRGTE